MKSNIDPQKIKERLWSHWARHILGINDTKEHLILEHNGEDLTRDYRKLKFAWEQLCKVSNNHSTESSKSWFIVMRRIKQQEKSERRKNIKKYCICSLLWGGMLLLLVWVFFHQQG